MLLRYDGTKSHYIYICLHNLKLFICFLFEKGTDFSDYSELEEGLFPLYDFKCNQSLGFSFVHNMPNCITIKKSHQENESPTYISFHRYPTSLQPYNEDKKKYHVKKQKFLAGNEDFMPNQGLKFPAKIISQSPDVKKGFSVIRTNVALQDVRIIKTTLSTNQKFIILLLNF